MAERCLFFYRAEDYDVPCELDRGHEGDHKASGCGPYRFGKRIYFDVQWRIYPEERVSDGDGKTAQS